MIELVRDGMVSIKKEIITEDMYKFYTKEQLLEAKRLLLDMITNYTLSTFEIITLLRKNYKGNASRDIYSIPMSDFIDIRFNCYYQSKVLSEEFKKIGIDSYIMTYKAHKYSTNHGDELIKEAHMSTIVPMIENDEKKIIIYDPGLKIDEPIVMSGYKKIELCASGGNSIIIDNDCENDMYPFYIDINGINKYSYNKFQHQIYQRFNPQYYTVNPYDIIFPYSFNLLSGYKATTFSLNNNKRGSIVLNPIQCNFKLFDEEESLNIELSYDEILQLNKDRFKDMIINLCMKLELDVEEIVENVFFMIEIKDDFISIINKNILEERNIKCKKITKE